jgi:hypothetical protein
MTRILSILLRSNVASTSTSSERSKNRHAARTPVGRLRVYCAWASDAMRASSILLASSVPEWSGQGNDLEVRVAGMENVAIDGDLADRRVLDRLAVLGVIADRAGSPESCKVGVALDRAVQESGQAPVAGVARTGAP